MKQLKTPSHHHLTIHFADSPEVQTNDKIGNVSFRFQSVGNVSRERSYTMIRFLSVADSEFSISHPSETFHFFVSNRKRILWNRTETHPKTDNNRKRLLKKDANPEILSSRVYIWQTIDGPSRGEFWSVQFTTSMEHLWNIFTSAKLFQRVFWNFVPRFWLIFVFIIAFAVFH